MNEWALPALPYRFRSETDCQAWLETVLGRMELLSPRCPSAFVRRSSTRPAQFTCRDYRYRLSVTSGTPLHGTHLSPWTWLPALYFMATSTHGVSARRLSSWLGIRYRSGLAHGAQDPGIQGCRPGPGDTTYRNCRGRRDLCRRQAMQTEQRPPAPPRRPIYRPRQQTPRPRKPSCETSSSTTAQKRYAC